MNEEPEESRTVRHRLEDLLGNLEWLKVDQAKKGGWKVREEVEEISSRMERIAEKLEGEGTGGQPQAFAEEEVHGKRRSESDAELLKLLDAMEERISRMSGKQVVPGQGDMEALRELIHTMDERVLKRKACISE